MFRNVLMLTSGCNGRNRRIAANVSKTGSYHDEWKMSIEIKSKLKQMSLSLSLWG